MMSSNWDNHSSYKALKTIDFHVKSLYLSYEKLEKESEKPPKG